MKNKLTKQEKLLQSKIEGASFKYNNSNWTELHNAINNKGIFGNFTPLVKALTGLIILTGIVFLTNQFYDQKPNLTPKEINAPIPNSTKQVEKIEQDKISPIVNELKDFKESDDQPPKAVKSIKKQNKHQHQTSNYQENAKQNIQEEISSELLPQENLPSVNSQIISIHSINVLSPLCINTDLYFEADLTTNVEENLHYRWYINNHIIEGSSSKTKFAFTIPGNHKVTLKASHKGKLLAEFSDYIYINPPPQLDFIATDLSDVFYDNDIDLRVTNATDGQYRWLKHDKTVSFGKETSFTYLKEGSFPIILQHTSEDGCLTTLEKEVSMKKDFIEAFPNTITINNDGHNEMFFLEVLQIPNTKFDLAIIDIKGEEVFRTKDPFEGWNGRINNTGKLLDKGIYAWSATIENDHGRQRFFRGKLRINPKGINTK